MARSVLLRPTATGLLVIVAMLVFLALRLQLSFDLGAFLPRHGGAAAEVLLQQLGSGPGSRLMVLGISGGELRQRQEASRNLQAALSGAPGLVQVLNGESGPADGSVPEPVRSHYPLQLTLDYSPAGLSEALRSRLRDLALGGGANLRSLVAEDPYLASLQVLQKLAPVESSDELWQSQNGSLVLLAETQAPATDLAAQQQAMTMVRNAFAALEGSTGLQLEITGVGPFGVELRQSIQAEATFRSILATLAVVMVLWGFYRSSRLLLLVVLPVGVGMLAGLSAVSLFFGTVHGITLAFGFTLMGVAVDFPLHLFSHQRSTGGSAHATAASARQKNFWRTLVLGAGSTAIAYLAMLFSGASGLAQLGLFSAVGVAAAVLVTRYWLPVLLPADTGLHASTASQPVARLRFAPALLVLLLVGLILVFIPRKGLWDDQLSSLSPVASERIARDRELRSAAAAFDMRYQLRIQADSQESLLQACERLETSLADAREAGLVAGWSSACQLLPSQQLQSSRRQQIPAAGTMHQRLQAALQDTPYKPDAFQPFEHVLQSARDDYPLVPADFDDGPLSAWLGAHLLHIGEQWFGLVNLAQPTPEALSSHLAPLAPTVEWMDLQAASEQMMKDFRHEATRAVAFAGLLILLVLALARTRPRRLAWVVLSVAASLSLAVAAVIVLHGAITLVHLVALLLVLGLGLDYGLFLSREESDQDKQTSSGPGVAAARHSITACALSTTLAFGILAGSSIPMLSYIGLTVAVGSLSAYLLALLGSRQWVGNKAAN